MAASAHRLTRSQAEDYFFGQPFPMPCNVLPTRKEVFNHFRYVQQLNTITNIPTVWKLIKIVNDDLQQIWNKVTNPT